MQADQEKLDKMLGGLLYILEKANTNIQSLDVEWEVLKPMGFTAATYTGWWRANKALILRRLMRDDILAMNKAMGAWIAHTKKVFESPDDPMSVAIALNNDMNYAGAPGRQDLLVEDGYGNLPESTRTLISDVMSCLAEHPAVQFQITGVHPGDEHLQSYS